MVDGDDEFVVHAGDFKEESRSHSTDDTESLRKIESEEESTVGSVCRTMQTRVGFSVMNSEFADIAPMLVAWYSAGYDTGLYAVSKLLNNAPFPLLIF
ncbi:hypothetical protein TNCV_3479321 [Trichonephila clavipes]|nr:hypothetical protein TNCV_3479321 [Trichonephila clavipes]